MKRSEVEANGFVGLAIVIGNNYVGAEGEWRLSNAESDALSVARNLKRLGYRLYSDDALVGRTSTDLTRDLSGFLEQRQRESPSASLFYFAGHAIESVRHQGVFLLGNEAEADRPSTDATALDLIRVVNSLKNGDGLSVIITDACRHLEGDKSTRSSASRRIRQALREAHNTLVYLTTKSENAAYDGKGSGPVAASIDELLDQGTRGLSVVEFLTEVRSLVAEKTDRKQVGELFESERLTKCFLMPRYSSEECPEEVVMATKSLSRHIDDSSPEKIKRGLMDLSQRFDEIISSNDLAEIDRIALVSTLSQRVLCANANKKEERLDVGDDLLAHVVEAKLKEVDIDKNVMPPKKIGIVSVSGRKLPVLARCSDDMAFLWLFISATEEGLNSFALSFQAAENRLSDEFGNFRQRIFS